jgi:hypothetical protein
LRDGRGWAFQQEQRGEPRFSLPWDV